MKLKKIASLALAGVMAVSMLAGCATKPTTTPDDGETVTETADYSEEVGKLVSKVPSYVKFEDNAALTAALEKAVQYVGVDNVVHGYVNTKKLTEKVPAVLTDNMSIKSDVPTFAENVGKNPLGIKVNPGNVWCIGLEDTLANTEDGVGTDTLDSAKAVSLYAVSTATGEDAVKAMIAKELADVAKYQRSVGTGTNNFNYDYVVSVSTCTKTVNSAITGSQAGFDGAADPAVTYIAVEVVRTATHQ